jgi:hypothetical protein
MKQEPHQPEWSLPDRLPLLASGAHRPGSMHPCAMEAASWLSGEPWSDHPRSVHPSIAAVARWVNDSIDDDSRQRLWPLILASVGTARRNVLLHWRLSTAAAAAKRRAAGVDPVRAWREVLDRYRELTSPTSSTPPSSVPPQEHSASDLDAVASDLDAVGGL